VLKANTSKNFFMKQPPIVEADVLTIGKHLHFTNHSFSGIVGTLYTRSQPVLLLILDFTQRRSNPIRRSSKNSISPSLGE
jgi:hypothetical protein